MGGRGEISDFEIRVSFMGDDVFIFCIREEPDLIPPELYGQIMYHANRAFALEARRGQRIEYVVPETVPLHIQARIMLNELFDNVFTEELPRGVNIYNSAGLPEGRVMAFFSMPNDPVSYEDLTHGFFEMRVFFSTNVYPYIAMCVRENYNDLPLHLRENIMREAELRFTHWESFMAN
jgi:hypothetical protein